MEHSWPALAGAFNSSSETGRLCRKYTKSGFEIDKRNLPAEFDEQSSVETCDVEETEEESNKFLSESEKTKVFSPSAHYVNDGEVDSFLPRSYVDVVAMGKNSRILDAGKSGIEEKEACDLNEALGNHFKESTLLDDKNKQFEKQTVNNDYMDKKNDPQLSYREFHKNDAISSVMIKISSHTSDKTSSSDQVNGMTLFFANLPN